MNNYNETLATGNNAEFQELEEGVAFITKRDGNGGEIQVINLDWPGWCPKEGIIELIPLKHAKGIGNVTRHQNEASFKTTKDKRYGFIVGMPMPGYDKEKNIQFERITIRGVEFLDLSNKKDRYKWICIKNGPFLVSSPNLNSQSKTRYMQVDKEKEARDFKVNRTRRKKAGEIAEGLWGQELNEMAVALGFDPKIMSPEMLSMTVIKFVENETRDQISKKTGAEVFLEIYNSDVKKETIILKRALSTGVVTHSITDGVLQYNGMALGHSENEAIQFLKNNPTTRASIDMLSQKTSNSSTQVHDRSNVAPDNNQDVIKRQAAEMEELKRQIAVLKKSNSKDDIIDEIIDEDMISLVEEAKRLGIKGAHLIKDRQKLVDKITEANVKVIS